MTATPSAEMEELRRRALDAAQSCHRPLTYPEDNDRIARVLTTCAEALRPSSPHQPTACN